MMNHNNSKHINTIHKTPTMLDDMVRQIFSWSFGYDQGTGYIKDYSAMYQKKQNMMTVLGLIGK